MESNWTEIYSNFQPVWKCYETINVMKPVLIEQCAWVIGQNLTNRKFFRTAFEKYPWLGLIHLNFGRKKGIWQIPIRLNALMTCMNLRRNISKFRLMSWVYIDIAAFSIIVIMYLHGKLWDGIELDGIRVGGGIDHLIVLTGRLYTKLLKYWDCASHNLFWKGPQPRHYSNDIERKILNGDDSKLE